MESELEARLRLLALVRVTLIDRFYFGIWGEPVLKYVEELRDTIEFVSEYLGIPVKAGALIKNQIDSDRYASTMARCCLLNDPIPKQLKRFYAARHVFIYNAAAITVFTRLLSRFALELQKSDGPSPERQQMVQEEAQLCFAAISGYKQFLARNRSALARYFPELTPKFSRVLRFLKSVDNRKRTFLTEVTPLLDLVVNAIVPDYGEICERYERAIALSRELRQCKPGATHAKKYERVCFEILRFLFVPPFRCVLEQTRTSVRDAFRDAVLPNNNHQGFWGLIRQDFNSRHIVCEFKNNRVSTSKDHITGLRIYLNKPTVGRFGLLFVRSEPTTSLLTAQRRAFEESQILILILTDKHVEKMLKLKAFTNDPEYVLNNLRISFELAY